MLRTAASLLLHPQATGEDRAGALSMFLDANDQISFARLLPTVPEAQRDLPAIRFQLVRFLLARDELREAVEMADAVPAELRTAAFDLLLANRLIRDARPEVRTAAFGRLDKLLEADERGVARDALRILASQPDERIDAGLAKKALARFENDPDLEVSEQLALRLFQMGLDASRREAIVQGAIDAFAASDTERLLDWLLRVGEPEKVVALTGTINPEARSRVIFQYRLTALRLLGRYEEMAADLSDPPPGTPPVETYAMRAAVAHLMGRASDEASLWKQAFSFAEMRPTENAYYGIARIAGEVGATEPQMEALASAIEHRTGIPPLADQLAPLFAWLAKNDTVRLLSVSRRLLQREPGNPTLINNYHYLATLYRGPDKETVAALRGLVQAFPEVVPFRGSLALAQMKSGAPAEALATLDAAAAGAGGGAEQLPDAEKAVYAASLAALGRKAESEELQMGIDWAVFDEGEADAFRELIAGAAEQGRS